MNRTAAQRPGARTQDVKGKEIGLVLVTHGDLAGAFLAAMQHIVGPQSNVVAVGIGPNDDVEARRAEILDALARVDCGQGAVVMTDMFGGTPSNLALSALGREGVEVIAGVNLPMLIKFASVRGGTALADAVRAVQEAGRKYINVASSFLPDGGGKQHAGAISMSGSGEPGAGGATLSRTVTIAGELGLHARPAARFVKLAARFDAQVEVTAKGVTVSGRSIMGLMMLGAGNGTELTISAAGPDAAAALEALTALVASGFAD